MRKCKRCSLPNTYPGIRFNKDYICNYCVYFDLFSDREKIIKLELKKIFIDIINSVKKRHKYDCIICYSCGKDSYILLCFLKKKIIKLNILAFTLDNRFILPTIFQNVKRITEILDIDVQIINNASILNSIVLLFQLLSCIFPVFFK